MKASAVTRRMITNLRSRLRHDFNETGDTLLEVLFTLAILGICVAGLLTAFSTTIAASAEQRGLVTLNTFVRAGSEELYADFQSGSADFVPCATASSYDGLIATLPALPPGYSEQIDSVWYLLPAGTAAATRARPDRQLPNSSTSV